MPTELGAVNAEPLHPVELETHELTKVPKHEFSLKLIVLPLQLFSADADGVTRPEGCTAEGLSVNAVLPEHGNVVVVVEVVVVVVCPGCVVVVVVEVVVVVVVPPTTETVIVAHWDFWPLSQNAVA